MFGKRSTYHCKITQSRVIIRDKEHWEKLVSRGSVYMSDITYRQMLDQIGPRDEVEASSTHQSGMVKKVIRDKDGYPVCLEVIRGPEIDYISIDRISLWEQYDFVPQSYGYYEDDPDRICWEWEDTADE